METVSSETCFAPGTCGPVSGKEPLSLLTLVDMALALDNQKPSEKDHTYAVAKKITRPKPFLTMNDEMLIQKIQKEKEHNYSSKSKPLRTVQKPKTQKLEQPTRSSSEENLSNVTFPIFSVSSSDGPRRTAVDDTSLNGIHKCYAFVKSRTPFHDNNDHTYPVITDTKKHRRTGHMSDAVEIQRVKEEPMTMDDSYLGSHSWPKENMFPPFRSRDENLSHTLPLNYKYDHTYAQGKNSDDEKMSVCDDSEGSNQVVLKTDHNYNKGLCDTTTNIPRPINHIRAPKLMLKNNRIDHNYSGFTGTFSAPQTQGSVESLDIDFSQSDTDSCEETEEEERRLAITSTISAWLQLRKDHPYSSI
ncbi:uncharacterized protein [Argopecten irradians]|uniref:uncharacterized protein n=1 Tax=Argopecten irradians TaxID=31199 RepID=UPI003721AC96